jgi:hypothetical protein
MLSHRYLLTKGADSRDRLPDSNPSRVKESGHLGKRRSVYAEAVTFFDEPGVPDFGTLLIVFRMRETIW